MADRRQAYFVQPRFLRCWLWWIAASTLGTTIALTGGAWLLGVLGSLLGTSFGALLLLSGGQAVILYRCMQAQPGIALRWFNYSVGAGMLGFLLAAPCALLVIALGVPGYASAASFRNHAVTSALTGAVAWGSAGAGLGVAQGRVLTALRLRQSWIVCSALGWSLLGATTIWMLLSTNFVQWPLPTLAVIILGGLLGGLLHGFCTATPLVALLKYGGKEAAV